MSQQVTIPPSRTLAVATRDGIVVPRVIAAAGDQAARRFLEFFAATHPQQEHPHGVLQGGLRFFQLVRPAPHRRHRRYRAASRGGLY